MRKLVSVGSAGGMCGGMRGRRGGLYLAKTIQFSVDSELGGLHVCGAQAIALQGEEKKLAGRSRGNVCINDPSRGLQALAGVYMDSP